MDAALAWQILQWVAVVVVYLGFAAVLRETRMLRAQVSRLQVQLATVTGEGHAGIAQDERIPARVTDGRDGIVVVADTTCPSCALVLSRITDHKAGMLAPITLLTWEPMDAWGHLDPMFRVVQDDEAWSATAHLTPPILLRVAADGRILSLHLPAGVEDVDATLASWGAVAPVTERGHA